ncbi:metallophosphoesterase family protein [Sporosarcina limicola]|uniref:DNA repair exonuclease SbcCD nuclease subunit n=1 Tax=Sporosarcina limicola TaxID=34101 RepID=A0A927REU2_9BACL|nr:DNA repair exonuclease [Sporosarcina limicola]MBE1554912.1 DNA repair exonuclease SbcCD nuclease subunit [Sporosarcina limicola]
MSTIRFIHTADLHLDSPFKGMTGLPLNRLDALRESTFTAFARLIDYALTSKPDFMLIVGDIYDGEDRSLRAQMKFHEGMEKLNAAGISVFISHGNHDHLAGRWTRFDLPPNVHVFSEDVEEVRLNVHGQDISIYGFSYKERHIRDKMVDAYPVAKGHNTLHIGMLHGSLAGDETHAVYAPFTKSELLAKRYDYWALGHIHVRQLLEEDPPIVYPGNLQGRHRNERGPKGFYEVELSKTGASLHFIPASAIVFERVEVSCEGISHANEWLRACTEALESFKSQHGPGIVELSMIDVDSRATDLFSQSTEEEWLDVLRDTSGESEPFVWVQKISFAEQATSSVVSGALMQSVIGMMDGWTGNEWRDVLKDVYQHARGVNYLDILTEDEIREVKAGATIVLAAEMSEAE